MLPNPGNAHGRGHRSSKRALRGLARAWNRSKSTTLVKMSKSTKAFRKQARTAERVAYQSGDAYISGQMRTLAEAFRAQAEILKKKRKKKK